jgi:hypothetical protein
VKTKSGLSLESTLRGRFVVGTLLWKNVLGELIMRMSDDIGRWK